MRTGGHQFKLAKVSALSSTGGHVLPGNTLSARKRRLRRRHHPKQAKLVLDTARGRPDPKQDPVARAQRIAERRAHMGNANAGATVAECIWGVLPPTPESVPKEDFHPPPPQPAPQQWSKPLASLHGNASAPMLGKGLHNAGGGFAKSSSAVEFAGHDNNTSTQHQSKRHGRRRARRSKKQRQKQQQQHEQHNNKKPGGRGGDAAKTPGKGQPLLKYDDPRKQRRYILRKKLARLKKQLRTEKQVARDVQAEMHSLRVLEDRLRVAKLQDLGVAGGVAVAM